MGHSFRDLIPFGEGSQREGVVVIFFQNWTVDDRFLIFLWSLISNGTFLKVR